MKFNNEDIKHPLKPVFEYCPTTAEYCNGISPCLLVCDKIKIEGLSSEVTGQLMELMESSVLSLPGIWLDI